MTVRGGPHYIHQRLESTRPKILSSSRPLHLYDVAQTGLDGLDDSPIGRQEEDILNFVGVYAY